MTSYASVVKAAQAALAAHEPSDWSDPDQLSDEQLEALAGPGYAEFELWGERSVLPQTIAGLSLLAAVVERR